LNNEPEIIALGERAHRAFPEIPFLGIDILREEPSGRLYVIEVNSAGDVWHFSSRTGRSIQQWAGIDFASQYGGLRRAAEILVTETRSQAR
jgi:glutathione synthase/RimK-type ligase-like ATP-grasp enzyme